MNDDDDIIELERSEDENTYGYKASDEKPMKLWVAKLILWATVIGGIAVGTVLFLFFLTVFAYLFVPLMILALIWAGIKYFFLGSGRRRGG